MFVLTSDTIARIGFNTIASTITSPQEVPTVTDSTLTSGCVIPARVLAYIPAMQLKQYETYDMDRQEVGDMKLEVGFNEVNVWTK